MSRILTTRCERCKSKVTILPGNGDSYIDFEPLGLFKIIRRKKDIPPERQKDIFDMFVLEPVKCECDGWLKLV